MLKIDGLTKSFGDKIAVDDLKLSVDNGMIYGFIGHNGAGKTTTIKSIVGILPIEKGDVLINGKSIIKEPLACKKELAYIPDDPDLYEYLKGIDYLNFIADVFEMDDDKRKKKIAQYANDLELVDDLGAVISSYSHGMKQKLAIIAAFMHDPKLIVMDEPFVGLDPKASHTLKTMMHDFCAKGGSIFFSTHVLEVAQKLCDQIGIIKNGRLIRHGKMEEVIGDDTLEQVFLELEGE